jgi:hypothetical protein
MPTGLAIGGLGAGASIFGALSGANAQEKAAQQASQTQMAMFGQAQQNLSPYMNLGTSNMGNLQGAAGNLSNFANGPSLQNLLNFAGNTSGITNFANNFAPPTNQAQLAQTPGYQFTLNQGLESTQNSFAAQGLGSSGAAMKGAAQYATGLADTTYNQQLQNYLNTYQTGLGGQESAYSTGLGGLTSAYSSGLSGLQAPVNAYQNIVGTGANAAGGLSQAALGTGQSIGSNILGAGAAQAGGNIAAGNAVSGLANTGVNYTVLSNLLSQKNGAAPSGILNMNLLGSSNPLGVNTNWPG